MKKTALAAMVLIAAFPALEAKTDLAAIKKSAVDLVNRGIVYIQQNGQTKAFKEFTNKKGDFVKGQLYIFVVDFNGLTLAHGGNEKLVGKNMMDLKDADNVYFIREMAKIAKKKGEGWVNYNWPNPQTKKIEKKSSYVKKMPGDNFFLGCGIYIGEKKK